MRWRLVAAFVGVTIVILLAHDIPLTRYLRTVETERVLASIERDAFILAGGAEDALSGEVPSDPAALQSTVDIYAAQDRSKRRHHRRCGDCRRRVRRRGTPGRRLLDASGGRHGADRHTDIGPTSIRDTWRRHRLRRRAGVVRRAADRCRAPHVSGIDDRRQSVRQSSRDRCRRSHFTGNRGTRRRPDGQHDRRTAATAAARHRATGRGRLHQPRPGGRRRPRDPQPRWFVQHHDGAHLDARRTATLVRRRRVAPVAHTVDCASPAIGARRGHGRHRSRNGAGRHRGGERRDRTTATAGRRTVDAGPCRSTRRGHRSHRCRRHRRRTGRNMGTARRGTRSRPHGDCRSPGVRRELFRAHSNRSSTTTSTMR